MDKIFVLDKKYFVLDKIILSRTNLILSWTKNILSGQMDRAYDNFGRCKQKFHVLNYATFDDNEGIELVVFDSLVPSYCSTHQCHNGLFCNSSTQVAVFLDVGIAARHSGVFCFN